MKNLTVMTTIVLLCGVSTVQAASATAVSVATNGGSSSATAQAVGNADATAYAEWGPYRADPADVLGMMRALTEFAGGLGARVSFARLCQRAGAFRTRA